LVWLLPVVVLVASRGILTWFAAPAHLVLRQPYGLLRRRSVGATLVGLGTALGLLAGLVAVSAWNGH
jgi:hypothetical protein